MGKMSKFIERLLPSTKAPRRHDGRPAEQSAGMAEFPPFERAASAALPQGAKLTCIINDLFARYG